MKKIRIIPRLDIKGQNVVKGIHTEGLRVVGNPAELARRYYAEGADEIAYMDIVASLYGRVVNFDLVKSVADEIFIPLTVGGGIGTLHDIDTALRSGADKVAINTHAVRKPDFLREAVKQFGAQCIVLSVEVKRQPHGFEIYTDGGREHTGILVEEWIKRALDHGIGEIFLTSIDRDGTRKGFDLELVSRVSAISSVPIIAHGGARDVLSVKEVLENGADAVAIGSLFHYKEMGIKEMKEGLKKANFHVRL